MIEALVEEMAYYELCCIQVLLDTWSLLLGETRCNNVVAKVAKNRYLSNLKLSYSSTEDIRDTDRCKAYRSLS